MDSTDYDAVHAEYARYRKPDVRIAALIENALGDARSVINVGAGTGSYEPASVSVVAVDASLEMLKHREAEGAAVQATAERLPFHAGAFDAALAILTVHHWPDREAGLSELRRVARKRVVLLTWVEYPEGFWLLDYFPEILTLDQQVFPTLDELSAIWGPLAVMPVPIPRDCTDGLLCAYWARPERYLDAKTRAAISVFGKLGNVAEGVGRLERDLDSGAWHARYGELLDAESRDFGYRLVRVELGAA